MSNKPLSFTYSVLIPKQVQIDGVNLFKTSVIGLPYNTTSFADSVEAVCECIDNLNRISKGDRIYTLLEVREIYKLPKNKREVVYEMLDGKLNSYFSC